ECGPERVGEANGAAGMAGLLAACASNGHKRMAILAPESRSALTKRLGQLIGTGTCKFGFGIVALPGARGGVLGNAANNWMAATLELSTEGSARPAEIIPAGIPRIATRIEKEENLCEEIFRWEIATCLACALMEVNPFSEPDVEEVHHKATDQLNG